MVVLFSRFVVHIKLGVSKSTSIKGSKWLNKFAQLIIILEVMHSETIRLFIEIEGVFDGCCSRSIIL